MPCFLIAMLPLMPKSPQWLLAKGMGEEARMVSAEFHANGQIDDELVLYEIEETNIALAIASRCAEVGRIFGRLLPSGKG